MKKKEFECAQVVKEKREEQKLLLGMQAEQERKLKKKREGSSNKEKIRQRRFRPASVSLVLCIRVSHFAHT